MNADDRILEVALEEALGGASPPDLQARIQAAAGRDPFRGVPLLPAILGMAAGALVALGGGAWWREPALAWERSGNAPWSRVEAGRALSNGREIRLPDGSNIDVAPGGRLTLGGSRPATTARLEAGTAFFSVNPGKERLSVAVPDGWVEATGEGTAFGVTVNDHQGGPQMNRTWAIGSVAAVLAVGVTSGVVHYIGGNGEAVPVKAGERLEVDRAGAAQVIALRQREEAVAAREKELQARAAELAAKEKAQSVSPAPPPPDVAEVKPVPVLKELSPEEKARLDVLQAAATLGKALRSAGDKNTPDQDKMKSVSDLMAAMVLIQGHLDAIAGDLAVDMAVAAFDAFMPEGLRTSEEQRVRFRQAYLAAEGQLALYDIPKSSLFGSGEKPLTELQKERQGQVQQEVIQHVFQALTPPQMDHLNSTGFVRGMDNVGPDGGIHGTIGIRLGAGTPPQKESAP